MGMTNVDTSKIDASLGIRIGSDDAPKKVIEYINLRCPYCKQWADEKDDLLQELVNEGKIQRVIKLFDKEKPGLAMGNVMHRFVPDDATAVSAIRDIFKTQAIWGQLEDAEEVSKFAEENLYLTRQDNISMLHAIVAETIETNVFFVPTVIVGTAVFDQKISSEELLDLLS